MVAAGFEWCGAMDRSGAANGEHVEALVVEAGNVGVVIVVGRSLGARRVGGCLLGYDRLARVHQTFSCRGIAASMVLATECWFLAAGNFETLR